MASNGIGFEHCACCVIFMFPTQRLQRRGHSTVLVGGTVTGLSSDTSVVLQNNGGDDTTVTTDGPFAFAIPVASSKYSVTVLTQPWRNLRGQQWRRLRERNRHD
jgi:hypothetical protein